MGKASRRGSGVPTSAKKFSNPAGATTARRSSNAPAMPSWAAISRVLAARVPAMAGHQLAIEELNAKGGDLKLCGMSKQVRAVFELVRMHRVFDLAGTVDEAANSMKWSWANPCRSGARWKEHAERL